MYKQFIDCPMPNDRTKILDAVSQLNTWIRQHPDYYVSVVGVFLHNSHEFILVYYQTSPRFQFAPLKLYRQFYDDSVDQNRNRPYYSAVDKLNGWIKLKPTMNVKVVKNFINHSTGQEFILVAYQNNN